MAEKERAYWLADKIPAYSDYAKEAALLLRQQADTIDRFGEALKRLHEWGGTDGKWNSGIVFAVNDWIAAGMSGPLPELPEWAKTPNC